ncbi:MAG: hypothetical protein AABW59_03815 [archaeon]
MPQKEPQDISYECYDDDTLAEGVGAAGAFGIFNDKNTGKLLLLGAGVVLAIIFLVFLALPKTDNHPFGLVDDQNNPIKFTGKIVTNGTLVSEFSSDGNILAENINVNEKKKFVIKGTGAVTGKNNVTIKITSGKTGEIRIINAENIEIDENGNITITIDPRVDLDVEYDENGEIIPGTIEDYEFEVIIHDTETDTDYIYEVPVEFTLDMYAYSANGCLALSRSAVSDFTHNGQLEVTTKVKLTCAYEDDLWSFVTWNSERMGNVEVYLDDGYDGTTIIPSPLSVKSTPEPDSYTAKIIFVPFKNYEGQKASFDVSFGYAQSEVKINFDATLENLEQCVNVSSSDSIIGEEGDTASITIDSTQCKSKKIEFYLCPDDGGCTGGAPEGEIDLSSYYYSSAPGIKTIKVERMDLAGAYGIPVYARVPGTDKVLIHEQEITISPLTEQVHPDKYVVSLLGSGSSDSVRIINENLADDATINTSICNLYNSSLGISSSAGGTMWGNMSLTGGWWSDLAINPERYAGEGKYQASIINTMEAADAAKSEVVAFATEKNALIKTAFLDLSNAEDGMNDATEKATAATTDAEALQDAMANILTTNEMSMAATIVGLVSSIISVITDVETASADLSTAITEANTLVTSSSACKSVGPLVTSQVVTPLTNSQGHTTLYLAELATTLQYANKIYSAYNTLTALGEEQQSVNAASAITNSTAAQENVVEAELLTNENYNYGIMVLDAASIDSFTSASSDHQRAKEYLENAKDNAQDVEDLVTTAVASQLAAYNDITLAMENEASDTEQSLQIASAIISLIDMIPITLTKVEYINATLKETQIALSNTGSIATAMNSESAGNRPCSAARAQIQIDMTKLSVHIGKIQATMHSAAAKMGEWLGYLSTIYTALQLYDTLANDYAAELSDTSTSFNDFVNELYNYQTLTSDTITALEDAIQAAGDLSNAEETSSKASEYTGSATVSLNDSFNKNRMIGLVGSIISNGFVNGAYAGGVYTTAETTSSGYLKDKDYSKANKASFEDTSSDSSSSDSRALIELEDEDCENMVSLIMPGYVTNLYADAKPIVVSNNNIAANWSFADAKVNDVFEKQETGMVFYNNGLKNTTYGTVEISFDKRAYDQEMKLSTDFGPFNIPNAPTTTVTEKYHFKFNAVTRKSSSPIYSNICQMGLLKGNTGVEGLPKVIMSWDWNRISESGVEGKYLDSAQLSAYVGKKLGAVENYLESTGFSCPQNPAFEVLKVVTPSDITVAQSECYLPLTTRLYDGKPALYYFIGSTVSQVEQRWSDEILVDTPDKFLKAIDFNVNMMRDGLGLDFQHDFVHDATSEILKTPPYFLDPANGMYRFFEETGNFYFTSEAENFESSNEYVIPDAGKYRILLMIDFDDEDTPYLMEGGGLKAKIQVVLYSLQPINNDFSPFYYTPIDGSVGLNTNNNRRGYGTNATQRIEVNNSGSFIDYEQDQALAQLDSDELQKFYVLNSLQSKKGKVLDLSYSFNGTTDDNSALIYSPSIATPILATVTAAEEENAFVTYELMQGTNKVNSNSSNLLLWNGLAGCKDFSGNDMGSLVHVPDMSASGIYGVSFGSAINPGTTAIETIAYSPVYEGYSLLYSGLGTISTANNPSQQSVVVLEGIKGMPYNDYKTQDIMVTIGDMFNAVEDRSLCVSRFGDREIFWWPEEFIYERESNDGSSFEDRESVAKGICLK